MDLTDNILLLEKEVNYGKLLQEVLTEKGYKVDLCTDNDQALMLSSKNFYSLYIADNAKFVEEARMGGDNAIILLLSDNSSKEEVVAGYKSGCDEYIIKPCPTIIILCKIESWVRRNKLVLDNVAEILTIGEYEFDPKSQILTRGGESTHLSTKEVEVLHLLTINIGHVVERSYILKKIWFADDCFTARSLSVYINHLRNKLKADNRISIISVHGKGYKLLVEN